MALWWVGGSAPCSPEFESPCPYSQSLSCGLTLIPCLYLELSLLMQIVCLPLLRARFAFEHVLQQSVVDLLLELDQVGGFFHLDLGLLGRLWHREPACVVVVWHVNQETLVSSLILSMGFYQFFHYLFMSLLAFSFLLFFHFCVCFLDWGNLFAYVGLLA